MVPAAPLLDPTLTFSAEVGHSAGPAAAVDDGEDPEEGVLLDEPPDDGVTVTVTVLLGDPLLDEVPHPAAKAAADPSTAKVSARAAKTLKFMKSMNKYPL
jgi:hypothetical protein